MIKLGIIGTGGMAEYQAKKFSEMNTCQLWACKDQHAEHAQRFAGKFRIPHWYTDLESMLVDTDGSCDAYTCAVLDERHTYIGKNILVSKRPLLMEKPLSRTLSEAQELAELAQKIKVSNLVNFSKRNAPALWALYKFLRNNYLGHIFSVKAEYQQSWVVTNCWGDWMSTPRWRWRLQPQKSTAGVIGDLGSHVVDALILLFGQLIPKDTPQIINLEEAMKRSLIPSRHLETDFYDDKGTVPVKASVTFTAPSIDGNDIIGTIDLSWINLEANDQFKITVYGEKGYALLDLSLSKHQIYLYDLNHNIEEIVAHPAIPSTYETFINHVQQIPQDPEIPLPDFKQGYFVQKTLDELFSGVLPS
jgi:predicted dehydrogenase